MPLRVTPLAIAARDHAATRIELAPGDTLEQGSNPGRFWRPREPLMPSSRNTEPSSSLLERLQLVLDGLAAITVEALT